MDPESKPLPTNASDQNEGDNGTPMPQPTGPVITPSSEPTQKSAYHPQVIRPSATPEQTNNQSPGAMPSQSEPPNSLMDTPAPVASAEPASQSGVIYNGGDSIASANPAPGSTGNKSFMTTFLLALLLGGLGADRYYLGKIGTGLLKMFTLGGVLIWAIIDTILILTNKTKDKNGNLLDGYDKNRKTAFIIAAVVGTLAVISGLFAIYAVSQAVKSVSETVSSVADLAKDCPGDSCTTDTSSDPVVTQLNESVVGAEGATNLDVSITSADVSPKTTGEPVDDGKQYVAVNFVVANSGSSDAYLPGMFYYKTPDGKLYNDTSTVSSEPTASVKNVKLTEPYKIMLTAGLMKKGEINANYYLLFQVPKGELGQVVWFSKAFDTNGTKLAIFALK